MTIPSVIELEKDNLFSKSLDLNDVKEMKKAFTFRQRVFCDELGWESEDDKEMDGYDRTSVHFGVFSKSGAILGYSRLHLPHGSFMIENEFIDLVSKGYEIRKEEDTVEASRFAVSRELRRTKEGFLATELLCRTMCTWTRRNGKRYWYMVLDKEYLDFLQRFFNVEPIGIPKEYEPGLASVAVIFDLTQPGSKQAESFWSILGDEPKEK